MKITVKRTRIELSPYKLGDSPTLENRLSIYDWETKKIKSTFFIVKNGVCYVPYGVGIKTIESWLNSDNIYDYEINYVAEWSSHKETSIFNINSEFEPKNIHQTGAIKFLTQKQYPIKLLMLDTGYGKTFCTIYAAAIFKIPTLIIVNTAVLLDQWKKQILKFTDCVESEIRIIKGSNSVDKILKTKPKYLTERFYIAQTQTLDIARENGLYNELLEKIGIGIEVFDEAHKLYEANNRLILTSNVRYTMLLTATPNRSDRLEDIMYNKIIRHIPKFGEYTINLSQYVNTINLFIDTKPLKWEERKCSTKKGFNSFIYEKNVFSKNDRIVYLYKILEKILKGMVKSDPEAKALVILSTIEHMKILKDLTNSKMGINAGELNSTIKNMEERSNELAKPVIFTSIGSAGAGLDIPNLRIVICFSSFTSKVVLHQLFGRIRYIPGKAIYYFNVIDMGYAQAVKQGNIRINYLKRMSKTMKNKSISMKEIVYENS